MLGWLRWVKLSEINLGIFKFTIDHPPIGGKSPAASDEPRALEPVATNRPPEPKRRAAPTVAGQDSPPRLTIYGEVVGTIDKDLGIRIRNEDEVREFWRVHQIDSQLDWFGKGPPVFSIGRKEDKARCRPGDEASMTVEVQDRANGKRGIRTVAFEVVRKD